MNDLELLDKYCETCLDFINPFIFNEINKRGLASFINYLPHNQFEAKAIVRARLAKVGRAFGDDEIDQIANEIKHLESLRNQLNNTSITDTHKLIPILNQMRDTSDFILSYFKSAKLPD